jgi:hypothetical protein
MVSTLQIFRAMDSHQSRVFRVEGFVPQRQLQAIRALDNHQNQRIRVEDSELILPPIMISMSDVPVLEEVVVVGVPFDLD